MIPTSQKLLAVLRWRIRLIPPQGHVMRGSCHDHLSVLLPRRALCTCDGQRRGAAPDYCQHLRFHALLQAALDLRPVQDHR